MTTYRFTGPQVTERRAGVCPTCGKKVTRSRTFERTVNPFNRHPTEDRPKTWDEVRADVRIEADAWDPGPEIFEHTRCRGARLAPPRAEPVGVSAENAALANRVRSAMSALITFTETAGLPLRAVTFSRNHNTVPPSSDTILAELGLIPDGEIIMWARACGLTELPVYDDNGYTVIRLRSKLPSGVIIKGYVSISKPEGRDRLGGAVVTGDREREIVKVDDLAEGLAVLGIAVVDPRIPTVAELVPSNESQVVRQ